MMDALGYSYDKALEYAAQLGDVNAILTSTASDDKKTKALKAMALQYGAAAEEINGLTQSELANLVLSKNGISRPKLLQKVSKLILTN